jgi:hypothetical protein
MGGDFLNPVGFDLFALKTLEYLCSEMGQFSILVLNSNRLEACKEDYRDYKRKGDQKMV